MDNFISFDGTNSSYTPPFVSKVDEALQATSRVLNNIRSNSNVSRLVVKANWIGLGRPVVLVVGIRIENKAYWPVLAGQLFNTPSGEIFVTPEDGVVIRTYKGDKIDRSVFRYIPNSYYTDRPDLF